jgi:hypothetical protein
LYPPATASIPYRADFTTFSQNRPLPCPVLDEQRHAIGSIDDLIGDLPRQRLAPGHISDHLGALSGGRRLRMSIVTRERPTYDGTNSGRRFQ